MQTWNDVISFIKVNLGFINKLEIPDDTIVENLRQHVLPFFSQFSAGLKKFKAISDENLVGTSQGGQPMYKYKIPLDDEEYIIDILNFYPSKNVNLLDVSIPFINSPESVIDAAITNSYIDAVRSLQAQNTWDFIPPNILIFDFSVGYGIIEYMTVHNELKTIDSDKYHLMFKKLCLANVKIWLAANRSKFENLNTPFGTLNLNWEALKAEGNQEKEEVTQLLNMIPADWLLHIDV